MTLRPVHINVRAQRAAPSVADDVAKCFCAAGLTNNTVVNFLPTIVEFFNDLGGAVNSRTFFIAG